MEMEMEMEKVRSEKHENQINIKWIYYEFYFVEGKADEDRLEALLTGWQAATFHHSIHTTNQ